MKFTLEIDCTKFTSRSVGDRFEVARCLRYLADALEREHLVQAMPVKDTYNNLVGESRWEEHCGIKITQKMIEAGVAALLPNEVLAPHTEEEIVTKIFLAMLDVARKDQRSS